MIASNKEQLISFRRWWERKLLQDDRNGIYKITNGLFSIKNEVWLNKVSPSQMDIVLTLFREFETKAIDKRYQGQSNIRAIVFVSYLIFGGHLSADCNFNTVDCLKGLRIYR